MGFHTVFFDLDATLYPDSNGLWEAIRDRIDRYMRERLHIPADQVPTLRADFYRNHGTTLKGLQAHYHIDAEDYLAFVHDLPLEQYLQPDTRLRALLLSLPARRWVLTNSDSQHAERVLAHLRLRECFDGVIDIRALAPYCKPQPEAYRRALQLVGAPRPQDCALLEDSLTNLETAREMGFFTVLVDEYGRAKTSLHRVIRTLHQLPELVPELWTNHHESETNHAG